MHRYHVINPWPSSCLSFIATVPSVYLELTGSSINQ
jgi:hypothetical protein